MYSATRSFIYKQYIFTLFMTCASDIYMDLPLIWCAYLQSFSLLFIDKYKYYFEWLLYNYIVIMYTGIYTLFLHQKYLDKITNVFTFICIRYKNIEVKYF